MSTRSLSRTRFEFVSSGFAAAKTFRYSVAGCPVFGSTGLRTISIAPDFVLVQGFA